MTRADPIRNLSNATARKKLILNVSVNGTAIVLQSLIGLAIAPYLVKTLGVAAYGMVALANSFPIYIRLLTGAVSNSVFRFVAVHANNGNWEDANLYFNTSFKALLMINIPLLVVAVIFSLFVPSIFEVPPGLEQQTSLLTLLILLSCLTATSSAVLQVPYPLTHNFYLLSLLRIAARVASVGLLVFCFIAWGAKLPFVGVYHLSFQLIAVSALFWFQLKFQKQLRIRRGIFCVDKLRKIIDLGRWVFVNDLAILFYLAAGFLIVNKTLGAEATGYFGPTMQLNSLLIMAGSTIANVLTPIFYNLLAKKDTKLLTQRLLQATRILGYIAGLIVLLFCGLSKQLLTAWLGTDFASQWPMIWMTSFATLFGGICFAPCNHIYRGLNKVKTVSLWQLVFGLLHVLTTFVLITTTDLGLWAFGLSYLLFFGVVGVFLHPYFTGKLIGQPWLLHSATVIVMCTKLFLASVALFLLANNFDANGRNLIALMLGTTVVYLAICPLLLSKTDIQELVRLVRKKKAVDG